MVNKLNSKTGTSKAGAKKTTQKTKAKKTEPVKKAKISNTLKPKSAQVCDKYLDMKAGRLKPITFAWLERFSQRLIDWATNDEAALHIGTFYTKEEVSKKDFYRLSENHSELKDALDLAIELIEKRKANKS